MIEERGFEECDDEGVAARGGGEPPVSEMGILECGVRVFVGTNPVCLIRLSDGADRGGDALGIRGITDAAGTVGRGERAARGDVGCVAILNTATERVFG